MQGLSNYFSSDEEEQQKARTSQPTAAVIEKQQQLRLIDSLPRLRTYPSDPNDSKWTGLQQPAVDALKAELWTPETSLQYVAGTSRPAYSQTPIPVAVAQPVQSRPPNVYPVRPERRYEYEGGFKEVIAGPGAIFYEDGGHFKGSIYKKMRHGDGTMVYADGNIYVGKWDMDQRHGDGGMTTWDGSLLYSGKWKNDEPL